MKSYKRRFIPEVSVQDFKKSLAVTPEFLIYNSESCKELAVANFHLSQKRYETTQLQMRMRHWAERTERDFRQLIRVFDSFLK